MPIPSVMSDLSTNETLNSPNGADPVGTSLDNYLRAYQAIIRTTNAKGADIASAATTNIGAATGEFVTVTGTTTITSLGTIDAGIVRTVHFSGVLTLTHNATSLILPGAVNYLTQAGDVLQFRSLGSGNWRCVGVTRSSSVGLNTPIVRDNIAALETLTGMANDQLAMTLGYYSDNDGGHGAYRYDSASVATVNGGTVINAAGGVGRWLLLHSGAVRTKQFGAKGDDSTNDSAALNAAAAAGLTVVYDSGRYKAAGLTQSTANQKFIADGAVRLIKNANGTLFSITANDVCVSGILFSGDASSPVFSGDNVVSSGNNTAFFNCGSMWAFGRALKATGSRLQIYGSSAIWQTADATAAGYDIEVGQSGVATLYHEIHGYQSSQATGGIKLTDVGSHKIIGGQFGKYTISAGTSPAGVNGGNTVGARILGDISIGLANAAFAGNTLGSITCTFAAGTSGHTFDDSNIIAVGGTIVDNSSNSRVVDSRLAVTTTYTPSWTAATTNPSIGDGTITGRYIEVGKLVTASISIVCGAATTYGSGDYYISLPSTPSTAIPFIGSITILDSGTAFFVGSCQSLTDGTARLIMYTNNSGNAVRSTVPMVWASGDELRVTLTYLRA